jgi:hypothetical protein
MVLKNKVAQTLLEACGAGTSHFAAPLSCFLHDGGLI